jgi:hypothetical protein
VLVSVSRSENGKRGWPIAKELYFCEGVERERKGR